MPAISEEVNAVSQGAWLDGFPPLPNGLCKPSDESRDLDSLIQC